MVSPDAACWQILLQEWTNDLNTETPDYDGRQALADVLKALENEDWPEWSFDS
jgi:hypothetical protein